MFIFPVSPGFHAAQNPARRTRGARLSTGPHDGPARGLLPAVPDDTAEASGPATTQILVSQSTPSLRTEFTDSRRIQIGCAGGGDHNATAQSHDRVQIWGIRCAIP